MLGFKFKVMFKSGNIGSKFYYLSDIVEILRCYGYELATQKPQFNILDEVYFYAHENQKFYIVERDLDYQKERFFEESKLPEISIEDFGLLTRDDCMNETNIIEVLEKKRNAQIKKDIIEFFDKINLEESLRPFVDKIIKEYNEWKSNQ